LIASGELKAMGITAPERDEFFPDIPTCKEQGFDFSFSSWRGFFAPKGTPKPIIDKLAGSVEEVTKNPEFLKQFRDQKVKIVYHGPEESAKLLDEDDAQLEALAKFFEQK